MHAQSGLNATRLLQTCVNVGAILLLGWMEMKLGCLWVIALDCANMAGSAHPLVAVLCVSLVLLSLCVLCAGESVAR